MGAIKREMNNRKWTWFAIGYECVFAYLVALAIYQIGAIFAQNTAVNLFGLTAALAATAFGAYMLFRPYYESGQVNFRRLLRFLRRRLQRLPHAGKMPQ